MRSGVASSWTVETRADGNQSLRLGRLFPHECAILSVQGPPMSKNGSCTVSWRDLVHRPVLVTPREGKMDATEMDNLIAMGVILIVPVVVLAVMCWRSARLAMMSFRSTRSHARR